MNEEYDEYESLVEEPEQPNVTLPIRMPTQWSWTTDKLLWVAGGVVVLGFTVWFLTTYTSAKARAIAAMAGDGDDDAK